jgi:DNA-binding CsgD family transcriptional regulator
MAASQGRLSQDALQAILSQLPFGLMVLDVKGRMLLCNPAAQRILQHRYGWRGTAAEGVRSLPWEILAGVEYLAKAARRRAFRSPAASLTLTGPDLYLHLAALPLQDGPQGRGPQTLRIVVVLKTRERSLAELWRSPVRLTLREAEVLQRLAQGKTRKEISAILQVSEATVRTHLEHLYAKLGVSNRVEAVTIALWQQLAEILTSTLPLA